MANVQCPSPAEAIEIAEEIERLEAVLKAKKEQLKAFVNQFGLLEVGGKVWGYFPSITWEFTPEKLKEMAREIAIEGENPWEYLDISASSLKKLGWGRMFSPVMERKKRS